MYIVDGRHDIPHMRAPINYSVDKREERRTWKRIVKNIISALLCKINYFKLLNLSWEHSMLDWSS